VQDFILLDSTHPQEREDVRRSLMRQLIKAEAEIERLRALVNEQAEDEGLWFKAETCAEAYVQQALRRLHAAIEGKSPEECARRALEQKP
jgi:hypothetical protein